MADDTSEAGRRRRPATIDVKATEIASDPVKPTEITDSPKKPSASEAAAGPRLESPKGPEPQASRPHWFDFARLRDRLSMRRPAWPGRAGLRVLAAGALGAAAALCVFLALWSFGAFAPRDDLNVLLLARLAMMEQQVREVAARPVAPAPDQRPVNELAARVGALEQLRDRFAALDARLTKIENGAVAPRTEAAAPDQGLTDRIAALETAMHPLSEIAQRVDAATAAAQEAKSRADAAFEAAQKNTTPPAALAAEEKETAALTTRVAALEQALKAAEDRLARAGTGIDRPARLAFTALALRSAVEQGEPFTRELAAVKPLADSALIAPLEPFAATGVPRNAALARELSQLATPMLNGAAGAREGGIFEKLQQNAERLVRIRPISETPGDDPATVISRAEVKATQGDLSGALAELARLPENVRAPAQGWIKKAEAQIAALAAARKLAENSAAALAP